MKNLILLFIVLVTLGSCSQNRKKINPDEQELAAQITREEKEKLEAEIKKQAIQTIADTFPPGFRFQEDRSVDPKHPPTLIDVLGTQQNIWEFKLSDFASSINYIKLETPSDSFLLWTHPKLSRDDFLIFSDDKSIFVQGLFGLARFNMIGNFRELIWKNESGINELSWSPSEFYGITEFNPVSTFNDNLFIRFTDSRSNQINFVKQKVQDKQVFNIPSNYNESEPVTIEGDNLFSIKNGVYDRSFETVFGLSENCWAGMHNTLKSAETRAVITVFSNTGDTLCQFSSANYSKNRTNQLVTENKPFSWYYKNNLTILELYSDTIFRIIPPNRMHPVFILDFGEDKVRFAEGINIHSDLSKKLLPFSIFETEKFIFIRYTRNSAGKKNLENKTVKFYNAVLVKNENQFYHFPNQSLTLKNIQNDLDGGFPFWPEYVTPDGKMLMLVSGKMMKEYVNSIDFKNTVMTEKQRQKQIGMANALSDFDKLVMVVE